MRRGDDTISPSHKLSAPMFNSSQRNLSRAQVAQVSIFPIASARIPPQFSDTEEEYLQLLQLDQSSDEILLPNESRESLCVSSPESSRAYLNSSIEAVDGEEERRPHTDSRLETTLLRPTKRKQSPNMHQRLDDNGGITCKRKIKHIHSERERRKCMSSLLVSLQELLPDPRPRKDRCTLLTEAIAYLQSLEHSLEELSRRKTEIMAMLQADRPDSRQDLRDLDLKMMAAKMGVRQKKLNDAAQQKMERCSSNVEVHKVKMKQTSHENEIVITFNITQKRGLWSGIFFLLQQHNVEVVNATFSTSEESNFHCIHAKVPKDLPLQTEDFQILLSNLISSYLE